MINLKCVTHRGVELSFSVSCALIQSVRAVMQLLATRGGCFLLSSCLTPSNSF